MNDLSNKWYKLPTGDKIKAFNFIIGGRGIGKSYDGINTCVTKYPGQFLYLRNTAVQLKESCGAFGNPFKRWSRDHNRDIIMKMQGDHAIVYEYNTDGEQSIIGYGAALSTFSNLRSIDLSDVNFVLFDEFIENRSLSFDQYDSFKHMYETVNRNRELFGEPPLYVCLLSNAQRLGNPILRGYDLIPIIEGMQRSGQHVATVGNKRIELPESEISELKKETALYQNGDPNFNNQALSNAFTNDSFTNIKKMNLTEYTPVCMIDSICIYRHKSNSTFYVCGTPGTFEHKYRSKDNLIIFMRLYGIRLKLAYGSDQIYFSDYATKIDLLNILNMYMRG